MDSHGFSVSTLVWNIIILAQIGCEKLRICAIISEKKTLKIR